MGAKRVITVAAQNASSYIKQHADFTADTDGTNALQAAIDLAADKAGRLSVAPPIEIVGDLDTQSTPQLKNGITEIRGVGREESSIRVGDGANTFPLQATGANNVQNFKIKDIKIDCNGTSNSSNGHLALTAIKHAKLENLHITGARQFGMVLQQDGDAISGDHPIDIEMAGCLFDGKVGVDDFIIFNAHDSFVHDCTWGKNPMTDNATLLALGDTYQRSATPYHKIITAAAFPSASVAGEFYLISDVPEGGFVFDGITWNSGDRLIPLVNNASTTTYAGNWLKVSANNYALSTGRGVRRCQFSDLNFYDTGLTSIGMEDIDDVNIDGIIIRRSDQNGVFIKTFSPGFSVNRVMLNNVNVAECGVDGISLGGGGGTEEVFASRLSNVVSYNNGRDGVALYNSQGNKMYDIEAFNNNQGGYTSAEIEGSGIRYSGGVPQNNKMYNIYAYDDQTTPTQRRGVYSGNGDNFTLKDGEMFGNTAGNLSLSGASNEVNGVKGVADVGNTSAPVAIEDEGVALTANANKINFTGAGVTANAAGDEVTVDVPGGGAGGGAIAVEDEGTQLTAGATKINFIGDGVSSVATGDDVTVQVTNTLPTKPAVNQTSTGPSAEFDTAVALGTSIISVTLNGTGQLVTTNANSPILAEGPLFVGLTAGAIASAIQVAMPGSYIRDDGFSFATNSPVYLAGTGFEGSWTSTPPSASGEVRREVGYCTEPGVVFFDPKPGIRIA